MFIITAALAAVAGMADPVVTVERGEVTYGSVVDVVPVRLDRLVEVATDCGRFDEWFPDMRDTHVVATVAGVVRCRGAMDLPWPLADRHWDVLVDWEPVDIDGARGAVVSIDYLPGSGNLEAMKGRYVLESVGPDGACTRVRYEAWVDLGTWLPDFVLGWATQRILPGVITGLEEQAIARAR